MLSCPIPNKKILKSLILEVFIKKKADDTHLVTRHHIPCRFETPAFRPEGAHPLARIQRFLRADWGGVQTPSQS